MMTKIRQGLAGILCALIAFTLCYSYVHWSPRKYVLRDFATAGRVLSNGSETFVELAVSQSGSAELAWKNKAPRLHSFLGLSLPLSSYWNGRVVVWHFQNGTASRVELPGVTSLPLMSVSEGKLTWTGAKGNAWQWDGERFQQVGASPLVARPPDEEDDDDGQTREQSLELKQAGWRIINLRLDKDTVYATVGELSIENQRVSSQAKLDVADIPSQPITDTLSVFDAQHTLLANESVSNMPRQIDRQSYETLAAASPVPFAFRRRDRDFDLAMRAGRYLVWPLLVIMFPFLARKAVRDARPRSFTYVPAVREQFPQLDLGRLDAWSRELEAQGFEQLLDGSLAPSNGPVIPGFTRIMSHKRLHLFAEVYQVFPPMRAPSPMGCGIQSFFDQDWALSVGNSAPLKASRFVRLPRSVSFSFPGATAAELVQRHLAIRQQMIMDLGIQELSDTSLSTYCRQQQRRAALRYENSSKGFFRNLALYYVPAKPSLEWRGDWPKEANKHTQAFGLPSGAVIGK